MMSIFKDEMFLIFVMISRSRLWFGHNIRLKSILFFSFSIYSSKIRRIALFLFSTECPGYLRRLFFF
jgi:hypothetical protein